MAAPIRLRSDFDAARLRDLAKRSRDPDQIRRLLALAVIYEGGSRADAARMSAVGLQTVRDWVLRFNAEGPEGLLTGKAPGARPLLNPEQRQALERIIEEGPIPSIHGVVRWRLVDLVQWVWEEFRITISQQTLSRELRSLHYRKLSARPRHHAKSEAQVDAFKNLWTGRASQEGCFRLEGAVRINLSGLGVELMLRAIMEIRAHWACLAFRPQRAIFKTRLPVRRATVRPSCHILPANLGGALSRRHWPLEQLTASESQTLPHSHVRGTARSRPCGRACWPKPPRAHSGAGETAVKSQRPTRCPCQWCGRCRRACAPLTNSVRK